MAAASGAVPASTAVRWIEPSTAPRDSAITLGPTLRTWREVLALAAAASPPRDASGGARVFAKLRGFPVVPVELDDADDLLLGKALKSVADVERIVVAFADDAARITKHHEKFSESYACHTAASVEEQNLRLFERLTRFYLKYCPSKINTIPNIIEKYSSDEKNLFAALVNKYGPEP